MISDKGYFNIPTAAWAGNVQDNRPAHHSLGNRSNHGIDIIQAPVKDI